MLKSLLAGAVLASAITAGDKEFLSVSAVGDWGGIHVRPYQVYWGKHVGISMNRVAATYQTDFLMLIGDNFYEYGVTDVNDPRFEQTYQATFPDDLTNLLDMPMYIQTGNHDYRGNVTAEIVYTDTQNRWILPSLWYKIERSFSDFSVDILMIDTNCLKSDQSIDEPDDVVASRRTEQYQWIEDELSASTADYIVVSGHHPVWSIAEHGPTSELVDNLLPLLNKYGVSLYINGHDHQLQLIKDLDTGIQYVTSGAATVPNPSRKHRDDLADNTVLEFYWAEPLGMGGYTQLIFDNDSLKVLLLDATDDSIKYQSSIDKRPKSSPKFHK